MSGVWIPGVNLNEVLAVVVLDDHSSDDDARVVRHIRGYAVELPDPPEAKPERPQNER